MATKYLPKEVGSRSQTATTVELFWSVSKHMLPEIDHFDIRYHPRGQIKWKNIATNENETMYLIKELEAIHIMNLKSGLCFLMEMRAPSFNHQFSKLWHYLLRQESKKKAT